MQSAYIHKLAYFNESSLIYSPLSICIFLLEEKSKSSMDSISCSIWWPTTRWINKCTIIPSEFLLSKLKSMRIARTPWPWCLIAAPRTPPPAHKQSRRRLRRQLLIPRQTGINSQDPSVFSLSLPLRHAFSLCVHFFPLCNWKYSECW